jgi:hypothetical protein
MQARARWNCWRNLEALIFWKSWHAAATESRLYINNISRVGLMCLTCHQVPSAHCPKTNYNVLRFPIFQDCYTNMLDILFQIQAAYYFKFQLSTYVAWGVKLRVECIFEGLFYMYILVTVFEIRNSSTREYYISPHSRRRYINSLQMLIITSIYCCHWINYPPWNVMQ